MKTFGSTLSVSLTLLLTSASTFADTSLMACTARYRQTDDQSSRAPGVTRELKSAEFAIDSGIEELKFEISKTHTGSAAFDGKKIIVSIKERLLGADGKISDKVRTVQTEGSFGSRVWVSTEVLDETTSGYETYSLDCAPTKN